MAPGQVEHKRDAHWGYGGGPGEEVLVEGSRNGTAVVFDHWMAKPCLTLPELKASVWIRANRPGVRILMHVVYPNQKDPETGKTLESWIQEEDQRWTIPIRAAGSSWWWALSISC